MMTATVWQAAGVVASDLCILKNINDGISLEPDDRAIEITGSIFVNIGSNSRFYLSACEHVL